MAVKETNETEQLRHDQKMTEMKYARRRFVVSVLTLNVITVVWFSSVEHLKKRCEIVRTVYILEVVLK